MNFLNFDPATMMIVPRPVAIDVADLRAEIDRARLLYERCSKACERFIDAERGRWRQADHVEAIAAATSAAEVYTTALNAYYAVVHARPSVPPATCVPADELTTEAFFGGDPS